MEDTASRRAAVLEIARLLEEHKAEDTVVLDVSRIASWTDFLVICTVRSQAHLRGLLDYLRGYLNRMEITAINSRKNPPDQGWLLVDCGAFVVNLMNREKREFYELEKLWFRADLLFQSSTSS
jgi:ribosome-associated protein